MLANTWSDDWVLPDKPDLRPAPNPSPEGRGTPSHLSLSGFLLDTQHPRFAQCPQQIFFQIGVIAGGGGGAGDEDVVVQRVGVGWQNLMHQSAEAAAAAVAHNGVAHLAAGGQAETDQDTILGLRRGGILDDEALRHPLFAVGGDSQKFGALFKNGKYVGFRWQVYAERRLRPCARRRDKI